MSWRHPLANWRILERVVFYGLLAISLIPMVAFTHFPTEDGPLHVANGAIYRFRGTPMFAEFYDFSFGLIPNMAVDLIFGLQLGAMSPELSHKSMALLLAIGLPLVVRWCLSSINRDAVWLAALVIPVAHGRFLYNGYWNFQLGVVVSFLSLGYWIRFMRLQDRSPVRWLVAACLFLLTYLSHAFPFLLLLAMVGAVVVNQTLQEEEVSGSWSRVMAVIRRMGSVLLAALLPLLLYLQFQSGLDSVMHYESGFINRLTLLPVYAVAALGAYEIPFAALLVAVVVVLAARSLLVAVRWQQPGFLVVTAVFLIGYFLAPDVVGQGTGVPSRIALFVTLLPLLWVARESLDRRVALAGIGAAAVLVLGLVAVRIPAHSVLDQDIAEYLSGREALEQGGLQQAVTVLPLWLSPVEEGRGPGGARRVIRPLVELAGFLMADGDVVDLHHLSPALDIFPFRFGPGLNIRETVPRDAAEYPFLFGPDMVDIEQYVEGGARVDYIWLWGRTAADPEALSSQRASTAMEYIDTHYRVVFVSEPRGMLEVYALR